MKGESAINYMYVYAVQTLEKTICLHITTVLCESNIVNIQICADRDS
jgi:hypothetical protein